MQISVHEYNSNMIILYKVPCAENLILQAPRQYLCSSRVCLLAKFYEGTLSLHYDSIFVYLDMSRQFYAISDIL